MAAKLNIWTELSGYSFGTFEEQVTLKTLNDPVEGIKLPVTNDTGVSYSIISGSLPGGVFLRGNRLIGAPFLATNNVNYNFCVRATKSGYQIPDRTFKLTVNGATPPTYITPSGLLSVGPYKQFYALDDSYIEYQIEAFAFESYIDKLSYFIAPGDGNLPPGVTLSPEGKLSGFIKPVYLNATIDNNGNYDISFYDNNGFDFNTAITDGFDTYSYDDVFFDFSSGIVQPYSLNLNYQFKVTVTDGTNFAQRVFRILVLGDDQFRADSLTRDGFAGSFTADSTFLRSPVWVSQTNLGVVRADNYLTLPVAIYDNRNTQFSLNPVNNEISAQSIALSTADNVQLGTFVTITSSIKPEVGYYFTLINHIPNATSDKYQISNVYTLGNNQYRLVISTPLLISIPDETRFFIGTLSTLPTGTKFDVNTGEIYGIIPYQPAITKSYNFTISAVRFGIKGGKIIETVSSSKTFSLIVLGNVTSQISWTTDPDLGTVAAEYPSVLNVVAVSNIPNAVVSYSLTSGTLPPGLELTSDGEIVGKINQYYNPITKLLGITKFDSGDLSFDNNTTTVDTIYRFTVTASDQYNYSNLAREFYITVSTPNTVSYSNIIVQPYMPLDKRQLWSDFINDSKIFTPASIYRSNNPQFGIQSKLKMVVYAGIETTEAAAYMSAIGLNHKKKKFTFGDVKLAIAVDKNTNNTVYEVVYVEMIDPLEVDKKYLPEKIHFNSQTSQKITADTIQTLTVDSQGYDVSDPNTNTYFPSSISIWRDRIKSIKKLDTTTLESERNYLPLWMRTIQTGEKNELGYVPAVVLCFCKAGTGADILLNIKYSGFDFKQLDYTIDRYTIDSVQGYNHDKYLVFRNDRITI
jgi:hypothetical protein